MAKLIIGLMCLSVGVLFAGETSEQMMEVLKGTHRSDAHKARDVYRHPAETLAFFQVTPDLNVVEISPGGKAWYMEILAPYLQANGTYVAASFDKESTSAYAMKSQKTFEAKLASDPKNYGKVQVTEFAPPQKIEITEPGTADRVLTFRNVHNWMSSGSADAAFSAFFKALKPGGMLGVVEHRAPAGDQDPKASNGYVTEAHVKELAKKAGFEFVAASEVNANPKDMKNHEQGVWTLPPALALGDVDRETYMEIGESDRMTLLFRKVAN